MGGGIDGGAILMEEQNNGRQTRVGFLTVRILGSQNLPIKNSGESKLSLVRIRQVSLDSGPNSPPAHSKLCQGGLPPVIVQYCELASEAEAEVTKYTIPKKYKEGKSRLFLYCFNIIIIYNIKVYCGELLSIYYRKFNVIITGRESMLAGLFILRSQDFSHNL
jgi:hypothetical protein